MIKPCWQTDKAAGACRGERDGKPCGLPFTAAHFVEGHTVQMCAACCIWCNRKPEEPTPPMQPIGKTIAGTQESMFGKGHNDD